MTRIELAALLGCSKSTVTKLVKDGMPIEGDQIQRQTALRWISNRTSGLGGGWVGGLRGRASLAERAKELLENAATGRKAKPATPREGVATLKTHGGPQRAAARAQQVMTLERSTDAIRSEAYRELLDRLCAESARIAEFSLKLGLKDVDLAAALPEMFIGLVFLFAGDKIADQAYDWDANDDRPMPAAPDYEALVKKYSVGSHDQARTVDKLEYFDAVLHGPPPLATSSQDASDVGRLPLG
jgi:hypothetical protein